MKILLLCDRFPNSYRDGLLLRVLHLVRQLRIRHAIDLICFSVDTPKGETLPLFERIWWFPPPVRNRRFSRFSPLLEWNPRHLYPFSRELESLLAHELSPEDYDLVWDAGASLFMHLPSRWIDVPLVADLVDDMVLTFSRAIRVAGNWKQRIKNFKYLMIHYLFEHYCMRRAALCCVVSDEDAASFRRISPKVPVEVVPNGVDADYFMPMPDPVIPGRLVFEGSMAFLPNQDAALFLVQEIMLRVWSQRPDATLTLVGRDPSDTILALHSDRVRVTGAVADVRPFVAEAEVFICPLRSGAGIKNKLLQAWAMGKAVIATSLSVGGLDIQKDQNVVVRDGAEAIAEAVIRLLGDRQRCEELGRLGRQTVLQKYTWPLQAAAFERLLEQTAAIRPRKHDAYRN